jgi:hypothetical protein
MRATANATSSASCSIPTAGDPATVTIRLRADPAEPVATATVHTRVTDEDGNPVAGVRVYVGYVANGATTAATTGPDGALTFNAEYAPATFQPNLDARQAAQRLRPTIYLKPGERDATVVLRRGAPIAGRVVGEDGRPLAGVAVTAYDGPRSVGLGWTSEDGRLAFAVPPGRDVDLAASCPEGSSNPLPRSAAELWGVAPGAQDLVLRMVRDPESRSIDVEVVDEAGAPRAGASVVADFAGSDWQRRVVGTVGADGRVRLEGLPRAPVEVSVVVRGLGADPKLGWCATPRRVPGAADAVRIVVPPPRVLRGRVVAPDGAPCAGAGVSAYLGGALTCSSTCGPDGRFEMRVPSDAPLPFPVNANPRTNDARRPLAGYDLVDATDRESEIVLHPVPGR